MLSRFHMVPERYGQTDSFAISISRISILRCWRAIKISSVERRYLSHYRNSVKNCFPTQNFTENMQSAAELWPKTNFNMAAVRHLQFKKLEIVIWLLSPCCSVSMCKISLKSDNLLLSYGQKTISKTAAVRHLEFWGPIMDSLKSPCRTSYWSSIETIALHCLVFEKIAFLYTDFGNRQTNERTDGPHRCVKAP